MTSQSHEVSCSTVFYFIFDANFTAKEPRRSIRKRRTDKLSESLAAEQQDDDGNPIVSKHRIQKPRASKPRPITTVLDEDDDEDDGDFTDASASQSDSASEMEIDNEEVGVLFLFRINLMHFLV